MDVPEKKDYTLFVVLGIIGIGFIIAVFAFRPKENTLAPSSTLVLSPTQALAPTVAEEPVVTSWRTYTNEKFGFMIDVPKDWNEQDYTKSFEKGGTIIAFSPNPLPCESCSYLRDGYYSVRVYNEQTEPGYYKLYQQQVKSVGKSKDYQPARMGKVVGIASSNGISVERNGWVYEVSLDTNEGKNKFIDSQIFQKAAMSFTFTGLEFEE